MIAPAAAEPPTPPPAAAAAERVLFVLIDGVGDVHLPQLGHRTPLEAARTPFLDAVAGAPRVARPAAAAAPNHRILPRPHRSPPAPPTAPQPRA